ncbi:MAG TPA: fumarylacetoacetate hydrolase family protein [Streptosporangiaceae bacterium]
MQLIRYRAGGGAPQVGILDGDRVRPLPGVATMADLLARPVTWIRGACETLLAGGTLDPGDGTPGEGAPGNGAPRGAAPDPGGTGGTGQVPGGAQAAGPAAGTGQDQVPLRRITVLAPVDGQTEVWAAGVTYERSMHARVQERLDSADIYDRVYTAPRPELFFKSAAWRVAGPGDRVSARADSQVDVPEPELAAALNVGGEVVGYTICNDMSSRSIEGENPLYLPQAKIYLGGCAAGPGIRPAWEVEDPYGLTIEMTISRDGGTAWTGQASTAGLRRTVPELAAFLFREDEFPAGVLLSTGTSLVPDLPFTLRAGDEIRISIPEIGELVNHVVRGKAALRA